MGRFIPRGFHPINPVNPGENFCFGHRPSPSQTESRSVKPPTNQKAGDCAKFTHRRQAAPFIFLCDAAWALHAPGQFFEKFENQMDGRIAEALVATPVISLLEVYTQPSNTRIMTIISSVPTVPPGAYPQDRLWGQVGMTPRRTKIKITIKIPPIFIIIPLIPT